MKTKLVLATLVALSGITADLGWAESATAANEDTERLRKTIRIEAGQRGSQLSMGHGVDIDGGFLGVQLTGLNAELRAHFGVAETEGVLVSKVIDDSAAFRAGVEVGDIITRVDGESIASTMDLVRTVQSHAAGDPVTLEIWRKGAVEHLTATLDQAAMPVWGHHRVVVDCEDRSDCDVHLLGAHHPHSDIECPDSEDCEIEIRCDAADFLCTVDGTAVDCGDLPDSARLED